MRNNRLCHVVNVYVCVCTLFLGLNSCAVYNQYGYEATLNYNDSLLGENSFETTLFAKQREFWFRPIFLYLKQGQNFDLDIKFHADNFGLVKNVILKNKFLAENKSDSVIYLDSNDLNQKFEKFCEYDPKYSHYFFRYSSQDSVVFQRKRDMPKKIYSHFVYDVYFYDGSLKSYFIEIELNRKRYFQIYPLLAFTYGG